MCLHIAGQNLFDRERVVRPLTPARELLVERVSVGSHGVAEQLEEAVEQVFTTSAWNDCQGCLQRQRRLDELLPLLAPAVHGRREELVQRDAQERRSDVRAVVDLLVERALAAAPDQTDWVNVQQDADLAPLLLGDRIEDMHGPEALFEGLQARWVLVQQVAEVGCGAVCCFDLEEHTEYGSRRSGLRACY